MKSFSTTPLQTTASTGPNWVGVRDAIMWCQLYGIQSRVDPTRFIMKLGKNECSLTISHNEISVRTFQKLIDWLLSELKKEMYL